MAFNIACGERVSLNGLIEALREISGQEIEPVYEDSRPGDVAHSQADISLAREHLGYEPRVSVPDGLRRVFEYYAELAR